MENYWKRLIWQIRDKGWLDRWRIVGICVLALFCGLGLWSQFGLASAIWADCQRVAASSSQLSRFVYVIGPD